MADVHTPKSAKNNLTDTKVRAFIAAARAGKLKKDGALITVPKLADGGGLYLTVTSAGNAIWRLKFRLGGTEKLYTIGAHSEINLEAARTERDKARAEIANGRDPVQMRKLSVAAEVASSGNLFNQLLDSWLEKERPAWSDIHYDKSKKALERHVTPLLGSLPVRDIKPSMVSKVIKAIQRDGHRETASKILQHTRSIFRLAQAEGLRADNPADPVIEILEKAKMVKHRPALLTFPELGELLRANDLAHISQQVRLCHRLIAFTAVRIGNAVEACWEEFDLDAAPAIWTIPRAKMKMRDRAHDHKVVLPAQIAAELRLWHDTNGKPARGWVFPGKQGRSYISREGVEKALHMMGFKDKHTCHGWRASFSTLAKDMAGDTKIDSKEFNQVVDLVLDHIHDGAVARAYDRGQRWENRIKLARWWGDALYQAQRGAPVIAIRKPQAA